jgi:hypothetical protein
MKKVLLIIILTTFAVGTVHAQDPVFVRGDKVLNLGIGLGGSYYTGTFFNTSIPPLSASLEWGFRDNFLDVENLSLGLGGYVGFTRYTWRFAGYGWNYTDLIIGARGAVHYPFVQNLDTYVGVILGPRIVITSDFGDIPTGTASAATSGLAWSSFVGARYFFSPRFALMGELGYGISYLNFGIALRM